MESEIALCGEVVQRLRDGKTVQLVQLERHRDPQTRGPLQQAHRHRYDGQWADGFAKGCRHFRSRPRKVIAQGVRFGRGNRKGHRFCDAYYHFVE